MKKGGNRTSNTVPLTYLPVGLSLNDPLSVSEQSSALPLFLVGIEFCLKKGYNFFSLIFVLRLNFINLNI